MHALSRPFVAVVCLLFVLQAGLPAFGQKFMPQEIVDAEVITPEQKETIDGIVDSPMFDLTREKPKPEDITEARNQLLGLFRVNAPTDAYLIELSDSISSRMNAAVTHESPLVRVNAMILLASMVDEGSEALIDTGLKDESIAVQRWAMEALGKRMLWWKSKREDSEVTGAIAQIQKLVDQAKPPHPIVVGSALDALVKVNTPVSREALIEILNNRVALHVADEDLPYTVERAAIESFTNVLVSEVPPDRKSITGLNRAMSRYASLIVDQFQNNRITGDLEKNAKLMLFQCMQSMANLSVTAKAPNAPPANHAQAKGWISNDNWPELQELVGTEWAAILTAEPFKLQASDLVVAPEE